jgi:DNA-binding Xre family transcriptional regulator
MIAMRIRIAELMEARKIPTAYALAKASNGALSMTNAHRLVNSEGNAGRVDLHTLEVLCDVFDVGPGELLERDKPAKRGR